MGRRLVSAVGNAIINAIADGAEIFERGTYQPTALLAYGLESLQTLDEERFRSRMRQNVCRLKYRSMIREVRRASERSFRLTELGRRCVQDLRTPPPQPLPQGSLLLVSFDIPERFRSARQGLRRYLKSLGFCRLHLSVWSSNYDWSEEISRVLRRLDVEDWVKVFHSHA